MKNIHLILFCLICFLVPTDSSAQAQFQKIMSGNSGEIAASIQKTADNGFIVGGETRSFGQGDWDLYLLKTNSDGDTIWSKSFGSTGIDNCNSAIQTFDGGYIACGETNGFGAGAEDIYLVRTDASGNLLWSKAYGGPNHDKGRDIKQTSDGGFIIAGRTENYGAGISDAILIKTDSLGGVIWTSTYGTNIWNSANSIVETSDGGYVLLGTITNSSSGLSNGDFYLVKTTSTGAVLWSKSIGGAGNDQAASLAICNDGGFILSGTTDGFGSVTENAYLVRTDSLGGVLWSGMYDNGGNEYGTNAFQTSDQGIVLVGNFREIGGATTNLAYLLKTDSLGDILFSKTYGWSSQTGYSVAQALDGGYAIVGGSSGLGGILNLYFVMTDSTGSSFCFLFSGHTNRTTPGTIDSVLTSTQTNPGFTESFASTGVSFAAPHITAYCLINSIATASELDRIVIYPNPSDGRFRIVNDESESETRVEIFDPMWRSVAKFNLLLEKDVDLSSFAKGFYTIQAIIKDGRSNKKLIIQ